MSALGTVEEVISVLSQHQTLRCVPSVEKHNGTVTVTIEIHADGMDQHWQLTNLFNELKHLIGFCQVRGFATETFGNIPPEALASALAAVLAGTWQREED